MHKRRTGQILKFSEVPRTHECDLDVLSLAVNRYGLRVEGDELTSMYGKTRDQGFGAEVKRRILMGTYALSAGYYDAFYKRAQQVSRPVVRRGQQIS